MVAWHLPTIIESDHASQDYDDVLHEHRPAVVMTYVRT